jgi:hypothetical protein
MTNDVILMSIKDGARNRYFERGPCSGLGHRDYPGIEQVVIFDMIRYN